MPKMESGKYPSSAKSKRDRKAYDKAARENRAKKKPAKKADPRSARVEYKAPTGPAPKKPRTAAQKGVAGEITKKKNQFTRLMKIFGA